MSLTSAEIAALQADLDQGLSLPSNWYTDPAIFALEQERIFRRGWQWAGRISEVAKVGDFFSAIAGILPVIVVRSPDGLRAFVNVCRHRRHEVVSGSGNRQTLQCPYHAWTYDLNGCLRSAPRSERESGFQRENYPLLAVQVATWGPWVFVNPALDAPPLREVLGDLPDTMAAGGIDLDDLRFFGREEWTRHANWKVMLENFLECYHCPIQHPGFSTVIDVRADAYVQRSSQWVLSQLAPVRAGLGRAGREIPYDATGPVTQAQYHFLWPNFTISINPGLPNLAIDVWIPDGPERTRGFSEHYFGSAVPDDYAREVVAFNDQVGAEDDRLTDSVQRGLRAGIPAQGRFLPAGERLVLEFQRLVVQQLDGTGNE